MRVNIFCDYANNYTYYYYKMLTQHFVIIICIIICIITKNVHPPYGPKQCVGSAAQKFSGMVCGFGIRLNFIPQCCSVKGSL